MTVAPLRMDSADDWIAANYPSQLRDWPMPDAGRLHGQVPFAETDANPLGYFAWRPAHLRRPATRLARAVLPSPDAAAPKCSHCEANSATTLAAKHGGRMLCERCRRYALRHSGALPLISPTGRATHRRSA